MLSGTRSILSHINPIHILNIISLRKTLILSARLHLVSQMGSILRGFSSLIHATRPAHLSLLGFTKCLEENIYKLHWNGKFIVDQKIVAYIKTYICRSKKLRFVRQWCTNIPRIWEQFQNYRCLNGDIK